MCVKSLLPGVLETHKGRDEEASASCKEWSYYLIIIIILFSQAFPSVRTGYMQW